MPDPDRFVRRHSPCRCREFRSPVQSPARVAAQRHGYAFAHEGWSARAHAISAHRTATHPNPTCAARFETCVHDRFDVRYATTLAVNFAALKRWKFLPPHSQNPVDPHSPAARWRTKRKAPTIVFPAKRQARKILFLLGFAGHPNCFPRRQMQYATLFSRGIFSRRGAAARFAAATFFLAGFFRLQHLGTTLGAGILKLIPPQTQLVIDLAAGATQQQKIIGGAETR